MSLPDRKYPKYPRYILVIFPALDYTVSGIVSSQEHYTKKSASLPFFKGQRHFLFLPVGSVTFFTAPVCMASTKVGFVPVCSRFSSGHISCFSMASRPDRHYDPLEESQTIFPSIRILPSVVAARPAVILIVAGFPQPDSPGRVRGPGRLSQGPDRPPR